MMMEKGEGGERGGRVLTAAMHDARAVRMTRTTTTLVDLSPCVCCVCV